MTAPRIEDILPLAPLQQGLLFHALHDTDGLDFYTVQVAVDLYGELGVDALHDAVDALVRRHAGLRSVFVHEGLDSPVQVVLDRVEVPWEVVDCSDLPVAEAEARFEARYDAERLRGFALHEDVPLRCVLFRMPFKDFRLAVTVHHIVVDGWSLPVLLDELFELYDRHGDESGMPPVAPYRDYLAWLDARDQEVSRKAWDHLLHDVAEPTLVGLPGRPGEQAPPARVAVKLGEELTGRLSELARDRGWTTNTVVQAAWGLTLGAHTGRTDVLFGGTVSGRPPELPNVERMVGLFINTLPVRVRWSPDDAAADLLDALQAQQTGLMEHQHVGLADIQARLGRGPLFDTTLVFENYPTGDQDDTELAGGAYLIDVEARDATHYPVTLIGVPGPALAFRLDHRPDLVDAATARRLTTWLVRTLTALVEHPDRPLGALVPLDDTDRERVLHEWNDTAVPVEDVTLTDLLERRAVLSPHATAVVEDGRALDYAALHASADHLARRLVAAGAGPDALVAVSLPRSADLVVALLAVLRSGAAYLPLDTDLPPSRRAALLGGTRPVCAVTDDPAAFPGLPVLAVRDAGDAPVVTPRRAAPDDLAYVIHTSGSTGEPKAVGVPHRGIVNRLLWMQDRYRLGADDRVLLKTPCTFDVSVWEFFWPLITGAAIVVAAPDGHRDPAHLARVINEHGVTTAHFVPSVLDLFLAEPSAASCPTLRRVVCSGEALLPATRDRFLRTHTAELHNLYGPTEASVDVTSWRCDADDPRVPIGSPVWNTRAYVLDARLAPVPPGVPGELYLAGVQLARGYLGRPGVTATRFVADPYGPPGSRLYRTGDLARWDDDGVLVYLGRTDDQVKIRGVRVELGEVESAVAGCAGVAHAAVAVREDVPGDKRLAAYYVPEPGAVPEPDALRALVAAELPAHLVPGTFTALDALPLNANGKLDRRALPAPRAATTGRAPRSLTEELLCGMFAEALRVDSFDPDRGFFAAGGHSLLAVTLADRVRTRFDADVTVRTLFEAPSPAELARRLDGAGAGVDALGPVLPLRAGGTRPPLFCLHPASGLSWCYTGLLGALDPDVPLYGLQAGPTPAGGTGTVGEQAARFADHVRAVAPHGPYRLLGWSMGGHLAHEVAVRLQDAGERVELLAVLDSYPSTGAAPLTTEEVFADAFAGTGLGADDLATPEGHDRAVAVVRAELGGYAPVDDDLARTVLATYLANGRALSGHTPRLFRGDLLFFRASDAADHPGRDPERWAPHVTGAIRVHDVPAPHAEMTRRDVLDEVAGVINAATTNRTEPRETRDEHQPV
ncbi:amino acid adenylation domain-containing protein [Saccharothrix longispora]|uniref:amino acid adenylation domain-containing protein n=1 Tax=Saccharothrix longispora TaxID=33920 RepID=UPI0028FDB4E7|nr:amino acid adenylation domain-containing protein [Saccharothrix longispora]MDU0291330.1 amino acid adenylation domain-containing protein [Saccharothrix longispora]